MARRNDHTREELKSLTLERALKIVKNEGFQKLTARRIAKEINYTPGTIYNMFGSMDGLYFALNAHTLDKLFETIAAPEQYPAEATISENIKTIAKSYMDFAQNNKELWLMLFNMSFPTKDKAPDWYREKVQSILDILENLLAPLFSENQTREKAIAARTIWSSVHGIYLMEQTNKIGFMSDKSALDMAECLIDNFIAGLQQNAA
ncbi:MAG TPA: TetR/AcrR family transcriptional regulator [Alphaproteobacteria bacterium]|nr:TetR/AcrR family transcriptional regulator [Alphaproteobacteria bacterium]USO05478.1 MAG: TetR/AcrR family transcriptional regulator [Rhodospirillales bacterium]HOO81609.1 TetR/AcrR family transcriptional regulator [Alphaproteobacteria bacterium]